MKVTSLHLPCSLHCQFTCFLRVSLQRTQLRIFTKKSQAITYLDWSSLWILLSSLMCKFLSLSSFSISCWRSVSSFFRAVCRSCWRGKDIYLGARDDYWAKGWNMLDLIVGQVRSQRARSTLQALDQSHQIPWCDYIIIFVTIRQILCNRNWHNNDSYYSG